MENLSHETALELARARILRAKERVGSVAPARMNEFPKKVQILLEDDFPQLVRVVAAAAEYARHWSPLPHAGCPLGSCFCGANALRDALDELAR